MRFAATLIAAITLAGNVLARNPRSRKYVRRGWSPDPEPQVAKRFPAPRPSGGPPTYSSTVIPETNKTAKFKVDGTSLPDVDFDIGESYAGLLPISDEPNAAELYWWFFPSHNPQAGDEILIWLNGGPGCSSLEGFLQENGPFLWQYGTYKPVPNQWSWTNLTNVIWVEQPAGTGFSKHNGTPKPKDEVEVARQFLGFWKNFVDTFDLHNRKIFLAGESYAGEYIPYLADAMHSHKDTKYFGIESILMYDPFLTEFVAQQDVPAVPFVDQWNHLMNLNASYMEHIHTLHRECGYEKFFEEALVFPPKGPLPTTPDVYQDKRPCRLNNDIEVAASRVNPCWDPYQIATTCPLLWDVMGFPGSFDYLPPGAEVYFNRTEVQKAINAPIGEWLECGGRIFDHGDRSPVPSLGILPRVIEKNTKTIIAHGVLDWVLILNGSLIAIQNMTWNGAQGFSKGPSHWNDFYVPYHSEMNQGNLAGAGIFGKWYEERGLWFSTVELAGHMVPQYAPSAAYRQVEFLLGRISDLSEVSDFTTQSGDFGNVNATMKML